MFHREESFSENVYHYYSTGKKLIRFHFLSHFHREQNIVFMWYAYFKLLSIIWPFTYQSDNKLVFNFVLVNTGGNICIIVNKVHFVLKTFVEIIFFLSRLFIFKRKDIQWRESNFNYMSINLQPKIDENIFFKVYKIDTTIPCH